MRRNIRERGHQDSHQTQVLVLGLMRSFSALNRVPLYLLGSCSPVLCKVLLREGRQGHSNQRGAWADSCHLLKGHFVCVWHMALPVPTRPRPAGTRASEPRTAAQPGAWAPGHTRPRSRSPAPPTQAPPHLLPFLFLWPGNCADFWLLSLLSILGV